MAAKKAKPKTRQKLAGFKWDGRRNRAAQLVAEGRKTNEEIAKECGVTRQAFDLWNANAEFKARVDKIVNESAEALKKEGVRLKENRLNVLEKAVNKMLGLIEARGAKMAETQEIEGGEFGLLTRDYKGKDADQPIYKFDASLLKELREYLKQAAIEKAEWTEKHEHKVEAVTQITTIEAVKPDGVD